MFENILGHKNVKDKLIKDVNNNTISHAYLFSGNVGIGKRQIALELAKLLLKTDRLETCADYKYIEKQPEKKDIIVEQVRDKIVNDVYIAPATSNYKVYIINDAENLNTAAQNALLKTLEEPPQYVVIILITSNEKALLTTVLSRVKKIAFDNLTDSEVDMAVKMLTDKDLSGSKLEYANGSLKVALDLVKEENNKYDNILDLYKFIMKEDKLSAISKIEDVNFKDIETFNYLEHLLMKNKHYDKISIVEKAKRRIEQNSNEDMVKQAFIIKMLKKE